MLGSLTLGGYDASQFVANPITFGFNQVDNRAWTVTIQEISFNTADPRSLLLSQNNTVAALIDSTVPYIYLPGEVCGKFEEAFGITFDDEVQAYLVNDTLHERLQQ